MSLYSVQKLLFHLNRDPRTRARFADSLDELLAEYALSEEEEAAVRKPDIGLLYVLGVNGQLLMHYAALRGYAWAEYLEAMRRGLSEHGPVRAGVYAATGYEGVDAHTRAVLANRGTKVS